MTPSICRRTHVRRVSGTVAVILATAVLSTGASAQALGYANESSAYSQGFWTDGSVPSAQQPMTDDNGSDAYVLPQRLQRQTVSYATHEAAGTIVIDTANTVLYYVLGNNRAIRYGVGVGREGFTWSGTQNITRKAEWPDWHPPTEMIARQPYLPRFMAGGPGNPLGARAMYLGSSVYRIHGTNDPSTIGKFVSSGCIRLTNPDVEDLFSRVNVGTRVVVLPKSGAPRFEARAAHPARADSTIPAPLPVRTAFQRQAVNQSPAGLY